MARDAPTFLEAYQTAREGVPAGWRTRFDAVTVLLLRWTLAHEYDLVAVYRAQLCWLTAQPSATKWQAMRARHARN